MFDDVVRSIGTHQAVLFVALDLSAAFDTVDYALLEDALALLGIQENAAEWFRSYLHDHEQQVVVKDAASGAGSKDILNQASLPKQAQGLFA